MAETLKPEPLIPKTLNKDHLKRHGSEPGTLELNIEIPNGRGFKVKTMHIEAALKTDFTELKEDGLVNANWKKLSDDKKIATTFPVSKETGTWQIFSLTDLCHGKQYYFRACAENEHGKAQKTHVFGPFQAGSAASNAPAPAPAPTPAPAAGAPLVPAPALGDDDDEDAPADGCTEEAPEEARLPSNLDSSTAPADAASSSEPQLSSQPERKLEKHEVRIRSPKEQEVLDMLVTLKAQARDEPDVKQEREVHGWRLSCTYKTVEGQQKQKPIYSYSPVEKWRDFTWERGGPGTGLVEVPKDLQGTLQGEGPLKRAMGLISDDKVKRPSSDPSGEPPAKMAKVRRP
jgi:hypothetical protein